MGKPSMKQSIHSRKQKLVLYLTDIHNVKLDLSISGKNGLTTKVIFMLAIHSVF